MCKHKGLCSGPGWAASVAQGLAVGCMLKGTVRVHTHAIWSARVPSTRARSYLVMYGVVIRFWLACGRSPEGRISTFSWPSCTETEQRKSQGVFLGGEVAVTMTTTTINANAGCQGHRTPREGLTITWGEAWIPAAWATASDQGTERNHDSHQRLIQKRQKWPGNGTVGPRMHPVNRP